MAIAIDARSITPVAVALGIASQMTAALAYWRERWAPFNYAQRQQMASTAFDRDLAYRKATAIAPVTVHKPPRSAFCMIARRLKSLLCRDQRGLG
jgi:hypothetical protein